MSKQVNTTDQSKLEEIKELNKWANQARTALSVALFDVVVGSTQNLDAIEELARMLQGHVEVTRQANLDD